MSSKVGVSTRVLAWLLEPRLGRVRAMERSIRLQGVMRFSVLTLFLIIAPSTVLAYFGIRSIQSQENMASTELQVRSQNVAVSFLQEVNAEVSGFEEIVQSLLKAGHSPLKTFHPLQRIALKFDQNQQLEAPFQERNQTFGEDVFFHPALQSDSQVDMRKIAERDYANLQYRRNPTSFSSDQRHHAGPKLTTLQRLEVLQTKPTTQGFRSFLTDVLAETWVVSEGVDASLARRALKMVDQLQLKPVERVFFDRAKLRVEERQNHLFWVTRWEEEWREVVAQPRETQPGTLHWQLGENGLWARTSWGDASYIFGFDEEGMLEHLRDISRSKTDDWVLLELMSPEQSEPSGLIARRYVPWLSGWSLGIVQKDAERFEFERKSRQNQQVWLIGFALFIMGFGVFLSIRVAGNEFDIASMKSNFAASVSHELRSPITQIRLKGESLMFGLVEDDELQENYESIVRESERLSWLVDNVLDYAALERGAKQFLLNKNDLLETLHRAIDGLSLTLTMREVTIEVNVPDTLPLVRHDTDAIIQCLTNLLSNAEKYSGEDKWISISLRVLQDSIDIVVSDRGIGIEGTELQNIFEPFFRSRSPQALRRKGTGIGLSVTKAIMNGHGGKVSVRSAVGVGSTFTLHFPKDLMEEAHV